MVEDRGNIVSYGDEKEKDKGKDNEVLIKLMSDLKEKIEKNSSLAKVVESEPRKVLAKTYIEGNPNSLKNTISSIINSYAFDAKGNAFPDRMLAVTLMVEDITQKK